MREIWRLLRPQGSRVWNRGNLFTVLIDGELKVRFARSGRAFQRGEAEEVALQEQSLRESEHMACIEPSTSHLASSTLRRAWPLGL